MPPSHNHAIDSNDNNESVCQTEFCHNCKHLLANNKGNIYRTQFVSLKKPPALWTFSSSTRTYTANLLVVVSSLSSVIAQQNFYICPWEGICKYLGCHSQGKKFLSDSKASETLLMMDAKRFKVNYRSYHICKSR